MVSLTDSVFDTIKTLLNIENDDNAFDQELIVHINSALFTLGQLGIGGDDKTPRILSSDDKWDNVVDSRVDLDSVKTYVYLKVRTVFDPPANAFVMTSMETQIKELEWRLNVQAEKEYQNGSK